MFGGGGCLSAIKRSGWGIPLAARGASKWVGGVGVQEMQSSKHNDARSFGS